MWTSAEQGEGSPVTFYERYGLKRTGDFHGNEILLRLEISWQTRRATVRRRSLRQRDPTSWSGSSVNGSTLSSPLLAPSCSTS
jgi:hypothetical protein